MAKKENIDIDFSSMNKIGPDKTGVISGYLWAVVGPALMVYAGVALKRADLWLILVGICCLVVGLGMAYLKKHMLYYWSEEQFVEVMPFGNVTVYDYGDFEHINAGYGKLAIFMKNKKALYIELNRDGMQEFLNRLREVAENNNN